jgi:hypothetical protein
MKSRLIRWQTRNKYCAIDIHQIGQALTPFCLNNSCTNPINHQNERNYFTGHFLCVERWENTTPGEITNSILKHGDITIINRDTLNISKFSLPMSAKGELEGLKTKRQTQPNSLTEKRENCKPVINIL